MTPNRGPVSKCAVKGCPFVGYWPEGQCCPHHRLPHTDKPDARPPTLAESWEVDNEGGTP